MSNVTIQGKLNSDRTKPQEVYVDQWGRVCVISLGPFPVSALYYLSTPILTFAGSSTKYFTMVTGEEDIVLISMNLQSAAGETLVALYESTGISGGTARVPVNTDLQSTTVFPGTYAEDADLPTGNTLVLDGVLLGQSQSGNFADGSRLVNLRLKKNTTYSMWITNNEAGSRDMAIEWSLGAVQ